MNTPLKIKYKSYEFGEFDIHLRTLKDRNQFTDLDDQALELGISNAQWPIFGVVWDSGLVMAHEMLTQEIEGKKILDVGCGMAIASHLLIARGADITATDYHPEVEGFLKENILLNKSDDIKFVLEDWNTDKSKLEKFDLIIGSDLLYEVEHIELLSKFLEAHANDKCEIVITDPKRGNANKFTRSMESFGFTHTQNKSAHEKNFKGNIHRYLRENF